MASWPSRSLLSSVLKAPALRTIRLTSSFRGEAGRAAPLDRRRWCHLPFRLRTNRTCRGPLGGGRRHSPLHLNGRRTPFVAPGPDFRVRVVHGLGGPCGGLPALPARTARHVATPILPPDARHDRALE